MIKKILVSLILGIFLTLYLAQYNSSIHSFVAQGFKQAFCKALDCQVTFSIKKINLFWPSLELENVYVYPKNQEEWYWHADTFQCQFSWSYLLRQKKIDLRVSIHNLRAYSAFNNLIPDIAGHAQLMLAPSVGIPINLKEIYLNAASLTLKGIDKNASLRFNINSKKMNSHFLSLIHI